MNSSDTPLSHQPSSERVLSAAIKRDKRIAEYVRRALESACGRAFAVVEVTVDSPLGSGRAFAVVEVTEDSASPKLSAKDLVAARTLADNPAKVVGDLASYAEVQRKHDVEDLTEFLWKFFEREDLQVEKLCGPTRESRREATEPPQATRDGRVDKKMSWRDWEMRVSVCAMRTLPTSDEPRQRIYTANFVRWADKTGRNKNVIALHHEGVSNRGQARYAEETGRRSVSPKTANRLVQDDQRNHVTRLHTQRFEEFERVVSIQLDATEGQKQTVEVALCITDKGNKFIADFCVGQSENGEMILEFACDLSDRGLPMEELLYTTDRGAGALWALQQLTDGRAEIQLCVAHVLRNVSNDHIKPKELRLGIGAYLQKRITTALDINKRERLDEVAARLKDHPEALAHLQRAIDELPAKRTLVRKAHREWAKGQASEIVAKLPEAVRDGVAGKISVRACAAWAERDYDRALGLLESLAHDLEDWGFPGSASSLREAMEGTLTVTALEIDDTELRLSVDKTQAIENVNKKLRRVRRDVSTSKTAYDTDMLERWIADGLAAAERGFGRVASPEELAALPEKIRRRAPVAKVRAKVGELRARAIGARAETIREELAAGLREELDGAAEALSVLDEQRVQLQAELDGVGDPLSLLDDERAPEIRRLESYERLLDKELEAKAAARGRGRKRGATSDAGKSVEGRSAAETRKELTRVRRRLKSLRAAAPEGKLSLPEWEAQYSEMVARRIAITETLKEITERAIEAEAAAQDRDLEVRELSTPSSEPDLGSKDLEVEHGVDVAAADGLEAGTVRDANVRVMRAQVSVDVGGAVEDPLDEFARWLPAADVARIGVGAIRRGTEVVAQSRPVLERREFELRGLLSEGRLRDEVRLWSEVHGRNAVRAAAMLEARRRLAIDAGADPVPSLHDQLQTRLGAAYGQVAGSGAAGICDDWEARDWLGDKRFLAERRRELQECPCPFTAFAETVREWRERRVGESGVSVEGVAAELVAVRRELAWRWLVERVRDRVAVAAELDVRVGGVREGGGDHGLAAAGELGGGRVSAARIGRRFRRCERLMGGDGRGLVERLTVGYREQLRRESTRVLVALRAELPDLWGELGRKDVARGARRYQSLCRDWGVAWRERRSELRRIAGEGQELWVSGVHPHAWLERAHFAAQVAAIDQHLVERGVVLEPDPGLERPPTPEITQAVASVELAA